jgi:fluoroacetyl-CoA thioesterase
LPRGYQSLGTKLAIEHFAATPKGMRVEVVAEVTEVRGRTLCFSLSARDQQETIGGGTHERVVVSVERFDERVQSKANSLNQ